MVSNKPKQLCGGIWVYQDSVIHETATLCPGACVGLPPSPDDDCEEYRSLRTIVGANCYLGAYSVLFRGAILDENVFIDCYSRVGSNTSIGVGSRILYGARIHNDVSIGKQCVIGGNCSNGVKIGNYVTHMGRIAHTYNSPHSEWAETEEPSPVIEDYAVIGANALIIGPVIIGRNSYVAAGEIVRKSIPPKCIVYCGKIYTHDEWKGGLKKHGYFDK